MAFENSSYISEKCRTHFSKMKMSFNEDTMISVLEQRKNKWDVLEAVIALREVGTEKSISALISALSFPMSDVKCSATLTIAKIAGANETEFFASLLEDKEFKEKGYALWALQEVGDARGLDAVISYLTFALKRAAQANPNGSFFRSIKSGLLYVSRFMKSEARVGALLIEWEKFLPVFRDAERKELLSAIPDFH